VEYFQVHIFASAPEHLNGKLSKNLSFPQMGHKHVKKRDSSKSYPNMRTFSLPDRNKMETHAQAWRRTLIDKIKGLTPTTSRLIVTSNTSHKRGYNHDRESTRT